MVHRRCYSGNLEDASITVVRRYTPDQGCEPYNIPCNDVIVTVTLNIKHVLRYRYLIFEILALPLNVTWPNPSAVWNTREIYLMHCRLLFSGIDDTIQNDFIHIDARFHQMLALCSCIETMCTSECNAGSNGRYKSFYVSPLPSSEIYRRCNTFFIFCSQWTEWI